MLRRSARMQSKLLGSPAVASVLTRPSKTVQNRCENEEKTKKPKLTKNHSSPSHQTSDEETEQRPKTKPQGGMIKTKSQVGYQANTRVYNS